MSVAGDSYWKQLGFAFVETGGAGGILTVLAILWGVIPLLEKAITGQAKVGIGELRCEIRELRNEMKTELNEIKAESESLRNEIKTAVVVIPLLTAAVTATLELSIMKTN